MCCDDLLVTVGLCQSHHSVSNLTFFFSRTTNDILNTPLGTKTAVRFSINTPKTKAEYNNHQWNHQVHNLIHTQAERFVVELLLRVV